MKCTNHQEVEAQALCGICNAPVCDECLVRLRDKEYCLSCLETRVDTLDGVVSSDKSTMLAFLFSLVPGAGYMYLGLMNRGLQVMILFFGTIFVAGMAHLDPILALVLPVVFFYNVFDTLQLVGRMREGVPVEDKPFIDSLGDNNWTNLLGYVLVGLGILALLNNFLPYYTFMSQIFTPLMIIALGVFILYRNLKRGNDDGSKGNQ